jgi:hypothetical protein
MTIADFDRRYAAGQTKAALQIEDFIAFFFAAGMTLGPLAATALYWR